MPKQNHPIWMAWCPADYLRDTRHLTCLQHGAYRQLIDAVFCAGGKLTATDEEIMRIISISEAEWMMIKDKIRSFFRIKGDTWSHKRVNDELRKYKDRMELHRQRTEKARHVLQQKRASVTDTVTKTVTTSQHNTIQHNTVLSTEDRKEGAPSFPSLEEVKTFGAMRGIPEADCVAFWNHFEASGWIDKHGHPVQKWQPKLCNWRVNSVSQSAEKAHYSNGSEKPLSILDMRSIIQVKEALCATIKTRSCSDGPLSSHWQSPKDREEFFKLRKEIRALQTKISAMA